MSIPALPATPTRFALVATEADLAALQRAGGFKEALPARAAVAFIELGGPAGLTAEPAPPALAASLGALAAILGDAPRFWFSRDALAILAADGEIFPGPLDEFLVDWAQAVGEAPASNLFQLGANGSASLALPSGALDFAVALDWMRRILTFVVGLLQAEAHGRRAAGEILEAASRHAPPPAEPQASDLPAFLVETFKALERRRLDLLAGRPPFRLARDEAAWLDALSGARSEIARAMLAHAGARHLIAHAEILDEVIVEATRDLEARHGAARRDLAARALARSVADVEEGGDGRLDAMLDLLAASRRTTQTG